MRRPSRLPVVYPSSSPNKCHLRYLVVVSPPSSCLLCIYYTHYVVCCIAAPYDHTGSWIHLLGDEINCSPSC
ncbi:Os06g0350200 [Oryza sativa Japonica Group]|uniref:Os06g0350200 protein n=1 Tax=Oryza sativa subsp. japonica TaxID=39947 RepID=A0A0P0WWN2_ORYSJ|nr:hypothetical protein EE612_033972 [Oryza sativa]BAS97668.1 Os06g0350200 [Oryza sativa Japonica Group]